MVNHTISEFIRKNDKDNKVKQAIANCIIENMNKEIALDVLSEDIQKRLYYFIYENEELYIDDGSNIKRDFTKTIRNILGEYFEHTSESPKLEDNKNEFIGDLQPILEQGFGYIPDIVTIQIVNILIEKGWEFNKVKY